MGKTKKQLEQIVLKKSKAPELVDLTAGSNLGNMVTSSGYDLYGRGFFLNASYRF